MEFRKEFRLDPHEFHQSRFRWQFLPWDLLSELEPDGCVLGGIDTNFSDVAIEVFRRVGEAQVVEANKA